MSVFNELVYLYLYNSLNLLLPLLFIKDDVAQGFGVAYRIVLSVHLDRSSVPDRHHKVADLATECIFVWVAANQIWLFFWLFFWLCAIENRRRRT